MHVVPRIPELATTASESERRASNHARELLRAFWSTPGEIDFSLVIPTYNRPRLLIQCLEAISQLTYPAARFEVIVVDDGGEDSLEALLIPYLGRINLTLLWQGNSGPALARNAGAAAARGHYVAFVDDDCRPDPSWLDALARCGAAHPGCAMGGRTLNGQPGNLFSTASQLVVQYLYLRWNPDWNDAFFIASNNLAVPRIRFLEIRGFDTRFPFAGAEDRELCSRWRRQGGRIVYAPDAIMHHFHALTWRAFLVQHLDYGGGAFIFNEIARGEKRAPVSGWPFYRDMPGYVLAQARGLRVVPLLLLVGLSQIVAPAGYLRRWCARPWIRAAPQQTHEARSRN